MNSRPTAGDTQAEPGDEGSISATRRWVQQIVVDLNLCPFARRRLESGGIRFACTAADSEAALLEALHEEILHLKQWPADAVATTLLIHPHCLNDFDDYNQFLDSAEALLEMTDSVGELQIASFHPHYRFAGTGAGDAENFSNRSPFPMLHLLREADVEHELERYPDADEIPQRNIARLRELGSEHMRQRLEACLDSSGTA